jgi:hypothetical protein
VDEITVFFVALFILLAIVTVVGHGIWVFLAALFGGRHATDKPPTLTKALSESGRVCPRCRSPLAPDQQQCAICNWPHKSNVPDGVAALHSIRRQLEVFTQQGVLDAETRAQLSAVINAQEHRLIELAKPVQLPPSPEPPPVPIALTASAPEPASAVIERTPVEQPISPLTVSERAQKYAAQRAAVMGESPSEPVTAEKPAPKREALSRLFAAFMEEKNIRWGELVGGLLIVGCSIALVISFWSAIAAQPLLKFVLFNGVTAALFGVGIYTDRRWKIHTTSHGLLIIATLLVPLNFLAIAAFTQSSPPTDVLSLGGEGISLAVFALLVFLAGRIIVPAEALLLAASVMIPSLMQLLIRRFADETASVSLLYGLAITPVFTYVVTVVVVVSQRWESTDTNLSEREATRLFTFLGIASAAALMPLALLLHNVPPPTATLHWLSPLEVACGLPALLVGLLFWRRMKSQTGLQTSGVAVGVVGAAIMVAATAMAWPDPATLLPTTIATALLMLGVAIWFNIPAAHLPAGAALAVAWLVGYYLLRGQIGWTLNDSSPLRNALLSAVSGNVLVPVVAAFAAVAAWLMRSKRSETVAEVAKNSESSVERLNSGESSYTNLGLDSVSSRMYGILAAATAAVSLALILWFGFGRAADPANIFWTLAFYAVGTLIASVALNRVGITIAGSALALAALGQGIVYRYNPTWQLEQPWIVALLAHATLIIVVCGTLANFGSGRRKPTDGTIPDSIDYLDALAFSALVTSGAAAAWVVVTSAATSAAMLCLHSAWIAAVWLVLATLFTSSALFTVSQLALVFAILCGVTSVVESRAWYAEAAHSWLDPWFLEAQGIAIAAYCLLMTGVRTLLTRSRNNPVAEFAKNSEGLKKNLNSGESSYVGLQSWFEVDRVMAVVITAVMAMVAVYAVVPGVAQELSPAMTGTYTPQPIEKFELAGIAHHHAIDRGAWLLLAAVATAVVVRLSQRLPNWRQVALVSVAMIMCLLVAARWEDSVAAASALRWLSAALLAVASIAIWTFERRTTTVPAAEKSTWQTGFVRNVLVSFIIVVYILLGAYIGTSALARAPADPRMEGLWPWIVGWTVPASLAALALLVETSLIGIGAWRNATCELHAWLRPSRWVVLLFALAPVAITAAFIVARSLDAQPLVGPDPASIFRRMGFEMLYGVPLLLIAFTFIGWAIQERSSAFAFAAGLLFNIVTTIVLLLRLARGGGVLDGIAWITVAQWNAVVAGIVAIVWQSAVAWHHDRTLPRRAASVSDPSVLISLSFRWPLLLVSQVSIAIVLCATFLVPALIRLFTPSFVIPIPAWVTDSANPIGWCAIALACTAAIWLNGRRAASALFISAIAAAIVSMAGLAVLRHTGDIVQTFHMLLAGYAAAACLLPSIGTAANKWLDRTAAAPSAISWSAWPLRAFDVATFCVALWEYRNVTPWWVVASIAAIGIRNLAVAWREGRRGFVWVAAALLVFATSVWWLDILSKATTMSGPGDFCSFLCVDLLMAAAVAVVSVWIERCRQMIAAQSVERPARRWLRGIAYHRFAAWAIMIALLLTTAFGLIADLSSDSIAMNLPLTWAAWFAAAIVAFACLWDREIRWPIACLYCVGLVAVGIYLDALDLHAPMFHWALANALAAYSLATSGLWSARGRLRKIAGRFGAPTATPVDVMQPSKFVGDGHGWLVPVNCLIGIFVLLLVGWIEQIMPSFTQRMVAAYAISAQAIAIGLLARGTVRTALQYTALVWGVLFAIAFGCAWIPPDFAAPWLHRLVVTVAALAAVVVVYGFGLVKFLKRDNEWTHAAMQLVPALSGIAVALIFVVLGIEARAYIRQGGVPIATPALIAVIVALVGLAVAALAAALLPGRDPFGLSERGRTIYVYIAEGLAALLFLHIRVTMPWLFSGWFLQFWPLVVMAIAFVGVGLSEVFARRKQRVLSEPFETTGAILPLLPAVGFWVMSSQVHYSLLLLSIGVLYAGLSVLRRSFWYGALAALAANGSLWYLLHKWEGLDLTQHPQLWLIPPALCALAAAYINRARLTFEQSAAIRYASAIVIYVSSTADIFINGVANAPWLPAVLAGLSILGVLIGILLRVRAFLYLGTAFLVVALMTIIWHAAIEQDRTWILWVAGILTGACIIALFGLFEKRRDDVLRVVEQLKHWEA